MATGNAIQSAQAPGTGGGTGTVTSVTATDTSIVVSGTATVNPTIATGTLDVIAADHPPAANWSNNSHKITSLANGSAAQDAAAFGQIPTALPPNGTAGGALSGTYPNPGLAVPVALAGAAAGTVLLETEVTADANERFTLTSSGTQNWGPGTGATDTSLSRQSAGVLATQGLSVSTNGIGITAGGIGVAGGIGITEATAGTIALQSEVTGDADDRFVMTADGTQNWGPGTGATDTSLSRQSAGVLATQGLSVSTNGIGVTAGGIGITAGGLLISAGGFTSSGGGTFNSGVITFGSGTDTSSTAAVTSPSFVTATALQLNTSQDTILYYVVKTAGTYTIAIGPANTTTTTLVSAVALPIGAMQTIRVPRSWFVKITGTIANLTITAVTC